MNAYEFVLGIILIGTVGSLIRLSLARKAKPADAPEPERIRDDVRAMRERIEVLERIVTEKETALDREIEQLRDR